MADAAVLYEKDPADLADKMQTLIDDPMRAEHFRAERRDGSKRRTSGPRWSRTTNCSSSGSKTGYYNQRSPERTRAPCRREPICNGGAGFIGADLTRQLLNVGHQVVRLDDLSGGFTDNVDPRAELVDGSSVYADDSLVSDLFADRQFDYVYHLAAYAAEGLSFH